MPITAYSLMFVVFSVPWKALQLCNTRVCIRDILYLYGTYMYNTLRTLCYQSCCHEGVYQKSAEKKHVCF